jgi:hypothetical protein
VFFVEKEKPMSLPFSPKAALKYSLLFVFFILGILKTKAQSAGFNNTFVILKLNGGANQ